MIRDRLRFNGEEILASLPFPKWSTTPCLPFETSYSIHLQLPSKLEAWGRLVLQL